MSEPEAVARAEVVERAQEIIGYRFRDPDLLVAALTHSSIADHRLQSNERLEFFGDAVLGMVICQELYTRFPDLLEGELTKIKSSVVSRNTCADASRAMGLPELLFLGKGMAGRSRLPNSLAAAVFEALIAAIHLDGGGLTEARRFILEQMESRITEAADSEHQNNFKSQLQQHAQKVLNGTPLYELLDEQGPDHSKCFEVCVMIHGRRFGSAWGPSKKEAEQKAAYNALCELHLRGAGDAAKSEAPCVEEAESDVGKTPAS
ncbi:MAG: ribonuclease III [Phycisphaerae bacterium]|nr:ribonuclease III [Phycisphaerae bacterium]